MWHREDGGLTIITNLITLCTFHPHLVHNQGWVVKGDPNGPVEFIRPDNGVAVTIHPPVLSEVLVDALAKHMQKLAK